MAQETQLAHRVLSNLALPYITNISPASTEPHYTSGSTDILTSINGYAERRPGFANTIETAPTTFNNLQRLFTWDRFDGTFFVMACDVNASGFAQVFKMQVGTDNSFSSIFTDTAGTPFDFVVSNNTLYFSNGHVAKKWDPINGVSNWGIAIGSINNAVGPTVCGNGATLIRGAGFTPWTNPNNATSSINFATCIAAATDYLVATQYGFAVAALNSITGIAVTLTVSYSGTGTSPLLGVELRRQFIVAAANQDELQGKLRRIETLRDLVHHFGAVSSKQDDGGGEIRAQAKLFAQRDWIRIVRSVKIRTQNHAGGREDARVVVAEGASLFRGPFRARDNVLVFNGLNPKARRKIS